MNQNKDHGIQIREEIRKTIIEHIEKYGYPPTVREIGELVGLKSPASVKHHLDQMIIKGILETDHECSPRAIRVKGYRFVSEEAFDKLYLAKCEEINTLQKAAGEPQKECKPKYLGENTAVGYIDGRCKCGNIVRSYQNFCDDCGIKLNWENVYRKQDRR